MTKTILKDTSTNSCVWWEDDYIYKKQPKHVTENEFWFLMQMRETGFVPLAERISKEIIRMEYLKRIAITKSEERKLIKNIPLVLSAMQDKGVRHGDLTKVHILPQKGIPKIIDWSESRLVNDPRPDKRPEGDAYWLNRSIVELIKDEEVVAPPYTVNTRASQIWGFIASAIDVRGKTIIDLGCGAGDLAIFALKAGAHFVMAIDNDMEVLEGARINFDNHGIDTAKYQRGCININDWDGSEWNGDIAICTSVLPYLKRPLQFLRFLCKYEYSIIECQYAGDGNGFSYILNDEDIRNEFARAGLQATRIGSTSVKEDKFTRTIWLCEPMKGKNK